MMAKYKYIASLIITAIIIYFWFATGLGIAIIANDLGGRYESRVSFDIVKWGALFSPILALVLYLLKKLYITISFSPNITMVSFLYGSYSVVKPATLVDSTRHLAISEWFIYLPGTIVVFILNRIPGYFPLYNNSYAVGLLKDFILTFSTIVLMYALLITSKILAIKFGAFIYDNYLKTYFEKAR